MKIKECFQCKIRYEFEGTEDFSKYFYRLSRNADGFYSHCKSCDSIKRKRYFKSKARFDAFERKLVGFFEKVELNPNGCWNWIGAKSNGYGLFRDINSIQGSAHRFSYWFFNGELIKGLTIDHLCRNRACVNPKHLEQVTYKENLKRIPRNIKIRIDRRTECIRGHEFTESNTRIYLGKKNCRACNRERGRKKLEYGKGYRLYCGECRRCSKFECCVRCGNKTKRVEYKRKYAHSSL